MIVVALAAIGAVVYVVVVDEGSDGAAGESATSVVTTTVETAPPTTPAPTVPPERLVAVDEIWLLDRGEGVYDWGLNVIVPAGSSTRSGVGVDVRLVDDAGEIVYRVERVLDGVDADAPSTVAGHFVDPDRAPTRLEFDVTVGSPSDDPSLDELLDTRAMERVDDEVRGRIRTGAAEELVDLSMVLAWRDDAGDIATAIVYDIDRLRPGVDARFAIDVDAQGAPDGMPDDVFWAPRDRSD